MSYEYQVDLTQSVNSVLLEDENVHSVVFSSEGVQGVAGSQIITGPTAPSILMGRDGDYYINTTTNEMFGPKQNKTWPVIPVFSSISREFLGKTFDFTTASSLWEIQHDLGYNPNVTTIMNIGTSENEAWVMIEGDVVYGDESNLSINFTSAVSGRAILS